MIYSLVLANAWATSSFPGEVQTELGMDCVPTCTLCHETNGGGTGTVIQEFGIAMMDRGLTGGGDVSALLSALGAMTADGVDSDADGTIDTDELSAGQNPNGDADFCAAGTEPLVAKYGCFNIAQAPASALGIFASFVAFGLAKRRR